jgi:hypothetical protein
VGDNGGTVEASFSSSTVSADPLSSQVGGLVGLNQSLVMTSFSSGSVTGDVQVGGLVGQNFSGATVMDSYSTVLVTGMTGGDSVGGLVGENDSLVETSYSIGPVMGGGATNVGGLVGSNTDTVTASFWATDTSGQATSAGGAGAIPVTAAQLTDYNTFVMAGVVGTVEGTWNFTPGTGTWGVNVVDSTGPLNGGLPVPQAITPIQAQVTATDQVVVYGQNPDLTTAYTVVGSLAGALASGPLLAIGGPNTDVGTSNPILIGGIVNPTFAVEFANGTETFSPATLTITGAVAANKIYDQTMTATLSSTGTVNGLVGTDTVSLDASGYSANFATPGVGNTIPVTVTGYAIEGGDSVNYTLTQPTGLTANITPAPLTVTGAVAGNKVYNTTSGDTLTSFGTLNGILGTDVVTIDMAATTASFASKNVGNNLPVTATYALGGADGGNYMVTSPAGLTANITPANLTVTGAVGGNKVYDATLADTLSSFGTLNGILGADVVTINMAATTANFASKDVGNNLAVTATYALGGTDGGNYTVTSPAGLTANITPATLTVTGAAAGNKIYDTTAGDTLSSFGTLNGVLGTDVVTINTVTTTASFAGKNVGNNLVVTATYALGGADGGDYTVTSPVGLAANITPATLTVTGAVAGNKVYDTTAGDTLASFGTLNGVLGTDVVTINTGTTTANFASKNVGNNLAVTATYALGGTDGGNYTVTSPVGLTANITPANLTVTGAVGGDKVYDATTADPLSSFGVLNGILGTDVVTINTTTTTASFAGKDVGNNLAVTATYALGGTDGGNYTVTSPAGLTANITPATLTVTGAAAGDKVYDATAADTLSSFGTLNGVLGTDVVTINPATTTASFAGKNVGNNLAVTATYALGGADGGDYTVTSPAGLTASITPATLTVTGAVAANKVYDGTTAGTLSSGGTLSGVLGTDNVTPNTAASTVTFASANAGNNLGVAVTGYALGGPDAGNYTVTSPTGLTANITLAPLDITANDAVKTSDGTSFSGGNGVSYNGFVNGETSTVLAGAPTYSGSSQGAIAIGNYVITPSGFDSSNYAIAYHNGNLAIIPAVVPGTVITPQTASIIASVLSGAIDAPLPTATGLGLTPPAIDVAVVLADDPSILGGAINNGTEDTGTYIAFGSSVSASGIPTLYRLLAGGAGTSIITNGYVTWVQPPANILSEFEQIFSAAVQKDLQLAAFTGNLAGGVTGSIPGASPYVLLLTPGGGAVVVSDGVVSPGQPPTLVIREFNTIFSADLQNQLQNAVAGSE